MTISHASERLPVIDADRGRLPVIGISVALETATWRIWCAAAHLLGSGYSSQVRRAGGIPLLLPVGGTANEARQVVGGLDGLVIPGGGDVDPSMYGQDAHPAAGPFDVARDEWEAELLRLALAYGVPVFGICRGMQLLNVVLGGSLIQHLPDIVGTEVHNPSPGVFTLHAVRTSVESVLGQAIGQEIAAPTYHHQAIDEIAPSLIPVAWADDGIVEALEDQFGDVLAVQWHPEVAESNAIFTTFVNRCATRRSARAAGEPTHMAQKSPRRGLLREESE